MKPHTADEEPRQESERMLEILAISGNGLSDLDVFMGAVRQLGVRHTLKKPFTLTELATVVKLSIGEAL